MTHIGRAEGRIIMGKLCEINGRNEAPDWTTSESLTRSAHNVDKPKGKQFNKNNKTLMMSSSTCLLSRKKIIIRIIIIRRLLSNLQRSETKRRRRNKTIAPRNNNQLKLELE